MIEIERPVAVTFSLTAENAQKLVDFYVQLEAERKDKPQTLIYREDTAGELTLRYEPKDDEYVIGTRGFFIHIKAAEMGQRITGWLDLAKSAGQLK